MRSRKDLHKLAAALGGLPVLAGTADTEAGVAYGDILISVNGRPTPNWIAFIDARALNKASMVCEVFRDGVTREVVVGLEGASRLDPAQLLAELIAERLVQWDPHTPSAPPNPN